MNCSESNSNMPKSRCVGPQGTKTVENSKRSTKPSALPRSGGGSGRLPNCETSFPIQMPAALTEETELLNMVNKVLPGLDKILPQLYLPQLPSLYLLQSRLLPGPPDLLIPGPLHMLLFLTRILFSPLLLENSYLPLPPEGLPRPVTVAVILHGFR